MSTTLVWRTTTNNDKCVWNKIKETDGVPEKRINKKNSKKKDINELKKFFITFFF